MAGNHAKLVVSDIVRTVGNWQKWPDISPVGDLKIVIVSGGHTVEQLESFSFTLTYQYGSPDYTGLPIPSIPIVHDVQLGGNIASYIKPVPDFGKTVPEQADGRRVCKPDL